MEMWRYAMPALHPSCRSMAPPRRSPAQFSFRLCPRVWEGDWRACCFCPAAPSPSHTAASLGACALLHAPARKGTPRAGRLGKFTREERCATLFVVRLCAEDVYVTRSTRRSDTHSSLNNASIAALAAAREVEDSGPSAALSTPIPLPARLLYYPHQSHCRL